MTPLSLIFVALTPQSTPSINSYLQRDLTDISWTAKIVKGVQSELKKINSDFGQVYRFESSTIKYKEPNKLRVESVTDDTKVTYVINGTMQWFNLGSVKISRKTDLSKAPGRRQTALDFGMLTPALFDNFFQAKFVRVDRATSDAVFDLTYISSLKDNSRHRIWVDPEKHIVLKREWYGQTGQLMATFNFEQPKKFGSVWMSTRLTVRNADNVVAGITSYDGIHVNSGLSDSVFSFQ